MQEFNIWKNPIYLKKMEESQSKLMEVVKVFQKEFIKKFQQSLISYQPSQYANEFQQNLILLNLAVQQLTQDLNFIQLKSIANRVNKLFNVMTNMINYSCRKGLQYQDQIMRFNKKSRIDLSGQELLNERNICEICKQNIEKVKLLNLQKIEVKGITNKKDIIQIEKEFFRNYQKEKYIFEQQINQEKLQEFLGKQLDQLIDNINIILRKKNIILQSKKSETQNILKQALRDYAQKGENNYFYSQVRDKEYLLKFKNSQHIISHLVSSMSATLKKQASKTFSDYCRKLSYAIANHLFVTYRQRLESKSIQTFQHKSKQTVKSLDKKIQHLSLELKQSFVQIEMTKKNYENKVLELKMLKEKFDKNNSLVSQYRIKENQLMNQVNRLQQKLKQTIKSYDNKFQETQQIHILSIKSLNNQLKQALKFKPLINTQNTQQNKITQTSFLNKNVLIQTSSDIINQMNYLKEKVIKYEKLIKESQLQQNLISKSDQEEDLETKYIKQFEVDENTYQEIIEKSIKEQIYSQRNATSKKQILQHLKQEQKQLRPIQKQLDKITSYNEKQNSNLSLQSQFKLQKKENKLELLKYAKQNELNQAINQKKILNNENNDPINEAIKNKLENFQNYKEKKQEIFKDTKQNELNQGINQKKENNDPITETIKKNLENSLQNYKISQRSQSSVKTLNQTMKDQIKENFQNDDRDQKSQLSIKLVNNQLHKDQIKLYKKKSIIQQQQNIKDDKIQSQKNNNKNIQSQKQNEINVNKSNKNLKVQKGKNIQQNKTINKQKLLLPRSNNNTQQQFFSKTNQQNLTEKTKYQKQTQPKFSFKQKIDLPTVGPQLEMNKQFKYVVEQEMHMKSKYLKNTQKLWKGKGETNQEKMKDTNNKKQKKKNKQTEIKLIFPVIQKQKKKKQKQTFHYKIPQFQKKQIDQKNQTKYSQLKESQLEKQYKQAIWKLKQQKDKDIFTFIIKNLFQKSDIIANKPGLHKINQFIMSRNQGFINEPNQKHIQMSLTSQNKQIQTQIQYSLSKLYNHQQSQLGQIIQKHLSLDKYFSLYKKQKYISKKKGLNKIDCMKSTTKWQQMKNKEQGISSSLLNNYNNFSKIQFNKKQRNQKQTLTRLTEFQKQINDQKDDSLKNSIKPPSRNFTFNFNLMDLQLFGGISQSYQYENFYAKGLVSKKYKYYKQFKQYKNILINQEKQKMILAIYQHIKSFEKINYKIYKNIKSFIKFPYQTAINKIQILDFTANLTLFEFRRFWIGINLIHRKCHKCKHIESFLKKIAFIINE